MSTKDNGVWDMDMDGAQWMEHRGWSIETVLRSVKVDYHESEQAKCCLAIVRN